MSDERFRFCDKVKQAAVVVGVAGITTGLSKLTETFIPVLGQEVVRQTVNNTVVNATVVPTGFQVANAAIGAAVDSGITFGLSLVSNIALTTLRQTVPGVTAYTALTLGSGVLTYYFAGDRLSGWLAPSITSAVDSALFWATSKSKILTHEQLSDEEDEEEKANCCRENCC